MNCIFLLVCLRHLFSPSLSECEKYFYINNLISYYMQKDKTFLQIRNRNIFSRKVIYWSKNNRKNHSFSDFVGGENG